MESVLHSVTHFHGELLDVRRVHCCPSSTCTGEVEHSESDTLVFPLRGAFVKHLSPHRQLLAEPTQALFFAAGRSYKVSHPSVRDDDCLVLQFAPDVLRDALAEVSLDDMRDGRLQPQVLVPAAELVARTLLARRVTKPPIDRLDVEDTSLLMLGALIRAAGTDRRPSAVRARTRVRRRRQAEAVRERIVADPAPRLDLRTLAVTAISTPFHTARLFREEYGISIHQYQLRVRLAHALTLLLDTDMPLGRIALDLGFATHSHFTSAFRRMTGWTPSRLRQQGSGEHRRQLRTFLIEPGRRAV